MAIAIIECDPLLARALVAVAGGDGVRVFAGERWAMLCENPGQFTLAIMSEGCAEVARVRALMPQAAIVVLTAKPNMEARQRALDDGASLYLDKIYLCKLREFLPVLLKVPLDRALH